MRSFQLLLLLLLTFSPARAQNFEKWETDPDFPSDVFTFIRLHPQDHRRWTTDYPDAEKNFIWRLREMTTLRVSPEPRALEITNPELFKYPFCYIVEPGVLNLSDYEAEILRRYLLNGGFLMLDDFWGEAEWHNVEQEMHKIFPDRPIVDLQLDHPVFHTVFDMKQKVQIPSIGIEMQLRGTGKTWEREDAKEVHFRAVFDDKKRMMIIICQNTDLGDGWEREGDNEYYFHEYSETKAYPMGINIIFYMMTH